MCFNPMNTLKRITSLSLFCSVFFILQVSGVESFTIPEDHDLQVKVRMKSMDCIVAPRLNADVKKYLDRYIFTFPQYTEKILANAAMYFPIFDEILEKYNMPKNLKALAVIESGLKQSVSSPVGAGGLWQLMPRTARMYGLTVNSVVDERSDIYRSTEAALQLLSNLYDRYDDWGVALAAYNAGTVRVNKALAYSGKENNTFWSIAPFLPKETQQFVPKFIAFNYLLEYYSDYGILPDYPDLDYQFLGRVSIFQKTSFNEIEEFTGIPVEKIKHLNPSFKRGYIPASNKGYNLVLPQRGITSLLNHISDAAKNAPVLIPAAVKGYNTDQMQNEDNNYVELFQYIDSETSLLDIANYYQTDVSRIKMWNHLKGIELPIGSIISIHMPLHSYYAFLNKMFLPVVPINTLVNTEIRSYAHSDKNFQHQYDDKVNHQVTFHRVRPSESIMDICLLYEIEDMGKLLSWNRISRPEDIRPGTRLTIYIENQSEELIYGMSF